MSSSLGVIINVILMLAILGALAYAMSRPRNLRPHRPLRFKKRTNATLPSYSSKAPHR